MASSTRLSAIPSQVNQVERTGEPVGSCVSGYERRPRLGSLDRGAEGSSENTLTAASNGLTTDQFQVFLDNIATGQRTN